MLRYFSRLLIFTLILTAPLSFTGDNCPDFKPASELRHCRQKIAAAVIVNSRLVKKACFADTPCVIEIVKQLTPEFHFSPVNACLNLPLHERAPPVIPVVS